jgi:hypothetical protein
MTDRADELVARIRNQSSSALTREADSAELSKLLSERLTGALHNGVEVLIPALGDLISEIKLHREALEKAAAASDKSANALVCWTRVLAAATIALVFATLILAWASIHGPH